MGQVYSRRAPHESMRGGKMPTVSKEKVGGWHGDPCLARWGCFLPDLTRLASGSSTTNLPGGYIGDVEWKCKGGGGLAAGRVELSLLARKQNTRETEFTSE
jgi:hypothetical protein